MFTDTHVSSLQIVSLQMKVTKGQRQQRCRERNKREMNKVKSLNKKRKKTAKKADIIVIDSDRNEDKIQCLGEKSPDTV
jgi:hypothetical protein